MKGGAKSMDASPIKTFIAHMVPGFDWPWQAVAANAAFASAFSYLWSTNLAIKWMFIGMLADMALMTISMFRVTGPTVKQVGSDALVKAIYLWIVIEAAKEPSLTFEVFNTSVGVGVFLAAYRLAAEWLNVMKLSEEFGLKWPPPVKKLLERATSSMDNANLGDKAISMFETFTQKTVGGKTITEQSTTIVENNQAPGA
jgi:hypothetical protein